VEQLKETLSTETNKTVTARTFHFSRYMAVDKVPVNELVDNTLGTHRVVCRYVIDSLVRKDDPPAEGVVGFVSLIYLNFMLRVLEFEADP
jgi:hypothetical protein